MNDADVHADLAARRLALRDAIIALASAVAERERNPEKAESVTTIFTAYLQDVWAQRRSLEEASGYDEEMAAMLSALAPD